MLSYRIGWANVGGLFVSIGPNGACSCSIAGCIAMRVVGAGSATVTTAGTITITVLTHHIVVEGLLGGNLLLNATVKNTRKMLLILNQKYPVKLRVRVMKLYGVNYQLKEAKGYLRVIVAYARIRRRNSPARCGQTRYSSTRIDRKHYV